MPERPPGGLPYHLVLTGGRPGWWRYVVGLGLMLVGLVILAPFVLLLPFAIYYLTASSDFATSLTDLVDLDHPTPAGLAYLNLTLAAAGPLSWFVVKVGHA